MKIANETNITWRNIDPRVRKITMFGLTFAMLIACLDGTIVGTCGPVIAAELNGTDLYAWMITAYMLCETVMIPISGKMSDHYGRKPLFFLGLGLFVGGSILAGMSTSMPELIVFRAIQGLGGGTLIPVAMAAVGDFYPPVQRGKIQGMLGAVFGLGSAIGPLLGGYIASYFSWRWVFYVNIPLAALSLALTLKQFPK
ncbi:MAG: MFS transporter, partial [Candidatus Methanomethylophilus sp.]|nr:MFS transporter [Methanomethylophilus sp.]